SCGSGAVVEAHAERGKPRLIHAFLGVPVYAGGGLPAAHASWIWINGVAEGLAAISSEQGGGQMLETRGTAVGRRHRKRRGTDRVGASRRIGQRHRLHFRI